jgi:hypothetical protein
LLYGNYRGVYAFATALLCLCYGFAKPLLRLWLCITLVYHLYIVCIRFV